MPKLARWQTWRVLFLVPRGILVTSELMTGRTCIPVIWEAWRLHFDILGVNFRTLGHHFDDPGVPRDTQQDTLGSRPGFLLIFDGFRGPLGTHFRVSLVICS